MTPSDYLGVVSAVNPKVMNKITDNILDLIPFHPVPTADELETIQNFLAGKCAFPTELVGKGASRIVHALPEDPKGFVVKMMKRDRVKKFGDQNLTEIRAFIEFDGIRKWLPQIFSYDPINYEWIVSERCILDRARLRNLLNDHAYDTANRVILRLKELGVENQKLLSFVRNTRKISHAPVRESLWATTKILEASEDFVGAFEKYSEEYSAEAFVDALAPKLFVEDVPSLVGLPARPKKKVPKKKVPKKKHKARKDCNSSSAWQLLKWFIEISHPIIVDLSFEMTKSSVSFQDLHEGNMGISQVRAAPFNVKIVDMGIVKSISDNPEGFSKLTKLQDLIEYLNSTSTNKSEGFRRMLSENLRK